MFSGGLPVVLPHWLEDVDNLARGHRSRRIGLMRLNVQKVPGAGYSRDARYGRLQGIRDGHGPLFMRMRVPGESRTGIDIYAPLGHPFGMDGPRTKARGEIARGNRGEIDNAHERNRPTGAVRESRSSTDSKSACPRPRAHSAARWAKATTGIRY